MPRHPASKRFNRSESQLQRYQAFVAADSQWSKELLAKFGTRAGDVRYTKEGQRLPGYAAFKAAGDAWRRGM